MVLHHIDEQEGQVLVALLSCFLCCLWKHLFLGGIIFMECQWNQVPCEARSISM